MKKVAILQSNYIPWKGYFDIINMVDEFVIFDTVQYTKQDWRNRNRIKAINGSFWLTIPVSYKGKTIPRINEITVSNQLWREKHWDSIRMTYSKAAYFKEYATLFEDLYKNLNEAYLSKINYHFIKCITEILGITTSIRWSSEFVLPEGRNEKLVGLCKLVEANQYLSGPAAKDYIDAGLFEKEGINVEWMDYSGYPEYKQLFPPFEHNVSIIDLIFNEGPNAKKYMKSFSK